MPAKDVLLPISRELYDALRAQLEAVGYQVLTRWRPGLRRIRLGPIVLARDADREVPR
jgi:hypothetical protein